MVSPGDIVLCHFPREEGGTLLHPAMVLELVDTLGGEVFARLVYGSSKRTNPSELHPWEFVIAETEMRAFAESGLHKTTRFDFKRLARLPASRLKLIGTLHMSLHKRVLTAGEAAGL